MVSTNLRLRTLHLKDNQCCYGRPGTSTTQQRNYAKEASKILEQIDSKDGLVSIFNIRRMGFYSSNSTSITEWNTFYSDNRSDFDFCALVVELSKANNLVSSYPIK